MTPEELDQEAETRGDDAWAYLTTGTADEAAQLENAGIMPVTGDDGYDIPFHNPGGTPYYP